MSYLLVIEARMLCLNGRKTMFDSISKYLGECTTLARLPSAMFESQFFQTNFMLEDIHVSTELGNCIPWQIQLKSQFAHFVVDEAADGFDFHDVGIGCSHFH